MNTSAKNKWKSQQIHKRFKNKHKNQKKDIKFVASKSSLSSKNIRHCCNKYTKNISSTQTTTLYNETTSNSYWTCSECTFDNSMNNLYCSMCQSPFDYGTNYSEIDNEPDYSYAETKTEISATFDDICMNHKWNKQRKCYKNGYNYHYVEPKYRRLSFHSASHPKRVKTLKKSLDKHYSEEHWRKHKSLAVKRILNKNLLCKFLKEDGNNKLVHVYHGTYAKNTKSIIDKGLVVGGTNGIGIRNGAAYGYGVYCSPNINVASGYESGSLFVCVVKDEKVQKNGNIWVVQNDDDILPIYLATIER